MDGRKLLPLDWLKGQNNKNALPSEILSGTIPECRWRLFCVTPHLGRCLYYMEAAVLESGEVEARGYRNVGPEHRGGREGQVPVTKIFI